MQAKRDQNNRPTLLGVSSVDGVTPVPIAVSPITGYLMIEIVEQADNPSPVLRQDAKMDANNVPSMLGYNGTNTQALITHNGYLAIQF